MKNIFLHKKYFKNIFFNFGTKRINKTVSPQNYKYQIDRFIPAKSKYAIKPEEQLEPNMPKYLENYVDPEKKENDSNKYSKIKDNINSKHMKPGKKMTLSKQKRNMKPTKEEKSKLLESENVKQIPSTAIDRINPEYIAQQREVISKQLDIIKRNSNISRRKFNSETLIDLKLPEKLSKRIARLGIASRNQAEKLIKQGMIRVDGQVVKQNTDVNDTSQIQVYTGSNSGFKTPMPQNSKIWLFHKPEGVLSTKDKTSRRNIQTYLDLAGFNYPNYYAVVYIINERESWILIVKG